MNARSLGCFTVPNGSSGGPGRSPRKGSSSIRQSTFEVVVSRTFHGKSRGGLQDSMARCSQDAPSGFGDPRWLHSSENAT